MSSANATRKPDWTPDDANDALPGVGKSTFIDAWGCRLVEKGHKVAVLAIDPSSSINRGSILGDKTRMEALVRLPEAFIRPSPSAGALGGVARKTRESMFLVEAAGFDVVLVETVGVGQSETTVRSMTDLFLLLQLGRKRRRPCRASRKASWRSPI